MVCSEWVNHRHTLLELERWPVTAVWAAASRSSGFTICCSEVTGRYWICPSWLTAIWTCTNMKPRALSKLKSLTLQIICLTCCSCTKFPSCSYWMIWPSGIYGSGRQSRSNIHHCISFSSQEVIHLLVCGYHQLQPHILEGLSAGPHPVIWCTEPGTGHVRRRYWWR